MNTRNTLMAVLAVALLATACTSREADSRSRLRTRASSGEYTAVRTEARRVLESKESHDPETVALAERLDREAGEKLRRACASGIFLHAFNRQPLEAVALYESKRHLVTELEEDAGVQKALMRLYVMNGNVEASREALYRARALAGDDPGQVREIEEFAAALDELETRSSSIEGMHSSLESLSMRTGVDYLSEPTPPPCMRASLDTRGGGNDAQTLNAYYTEVDACRQLVQRLSDLGNTL